MSISDAFVQLKASLELKDYLDAIVQQRHTAVRASIHNSGLPITETKLIGSYQRKTRIHPVLTDEFDLDILVVLGEFSGWVQQGKGVTPVEAMRGVHRVLEESERYSAMRPYVDSPTVTLVSKTNLKVELVPAYVDMIGRDQLGVEHSPINRAYWVPDLNNSAKWMLADYDYDAEQVSNINMTMNGAFIPTVKMLKAIKRKFFPFLPSYCLEVLAAATLPGEFVTRRILQMPTNYQQLLRAFFSSAANHLDRPLAFKGSLTPGKILNPGEKMSLTNGFSETSQYLSRLIELGEQKEAFDGWKQLFGVSFPSE